MYICQYLTIGMFFASLNLNNIGLSRSLILLNHFF